MQSVYLDVIYESPFLYKEGTGMGDVKGEPTM